MSDNYLASVTLWPSALLTNSLCGHSRTYGRGALRMSDNCPVSVTLWLSALLRNAKSAAEMPRILQQEKEERKK